MGGVYDSSKPKARGSWQMTRFELRVGFEAFPWQVPRWRAGCTRGVGQNRNEYSSSSLLR